MLKKGLKRCVLSGTAGVLLLCGYEGQSDIMAEEYYMEEGYVDYYEEIPVYEGGEFYEEYQYAEPLYEEYHGRHDYFEYEEYYEEGHDEGFEEEYRDEDEFVDETEEEETEFRGKSDPEYGPDEYHERRKLEDTYRFRNNPNESKFEDFKIFTKEDAEEFFDIYYLDSLPRQFNLDIPEVLQMPELPTGCESVALTMALRYEGFDLLKTEIAAEFLLYNLHDENAAIGFIGDPFDDSGAGCFAPALAATANNFFIDQKANYRAFDISKTEFEDLLSYVSDGTPVMVWSTMYMDDVDFTGESGEFNGEEYKWYKGEHCVLLTGYDLDEGVLYINDPLEGSIERDYEEFRQIYEKIGEYAVIVACLDPVDIEEMEAGKALPVVEFAIQETETETEETTEKESEIKE